MQSEDTDKYLNTSGKQERICRHKLMDIRKGIPADPQSDYQQVKSSLRHLWYIHSPHWPAASHIATNANSAACLWDIQPGLALPAPGSQVTEELSTIDALQDKIYAVLIMEKSQRLDDELAVHNLQNVPLCSKVRHLRQATRNQMQWSFEWFAEHDRCPQLEDKMVPVGFL